jgi:prepilin-type processing-associated H-X9-DG protein
MANGKAKKVIAWVLAGFLVVIVLLVVLYMALQPHLSCGWQMQGLGTYFEVYAFDFDDKLPTENWCDSLLSQVDMGPGNLISLSSDCVVGESSYALNLAATELGDFAPDDMVLAFETSAGREGKRKNLDAKRKSFHKDEKVGKVYRDRWNQIGGPELLTLEYNYGIGAYILFADWHVEFIWARNLPKLRWNVDDTVKLTKEDVQRLVKEAKKAKN